MKSDFKSEKGKVLYSDYSIFLGKKSYINRLVIDSGETRETTKMN